MSEVINRTLILDPQRMALSEVLRQDWVVNAEEGTAIEDVLKPAYWSHMSMNMNVYDHIEVRLETGEWILELIVLEQGRNWARVYLAHQHNLRRIEAQSETVPSVVAQHEVAWKGPQHKYAVIRTSDGQMIQNGFVEKVAAFEWLTNHEKATQKA
jgi:hypothetical protein